MDWNRIRDHYAMLMEQFGLTQVVVATRANLHQSAISKLLDNRRCGPSVQVFAKAVTGLGMSLPAFFTGLEQQPPSAPRAVDAASMLERLESLEVAMAAAARDYGRSHDPSTSAFSDHRNVINIGVDKEFEQTVSAHFHAIREQVDRIVDHLATPLPTHGKADRDQAATRPRHRRRVRKTA